MEVLPAGVKHSKQAVIQEQPFCLNHAFLLNVAMLMLLVPNSRDVLPSNTRGDK